MKFARTLCLGSLVAALFAPAGCAEVAMVGAAPIAVVPMNQQWSLDRVGAWRVPVSIETTPGVSREISAGTFSLRDDWTWSFRYDHHDTSATTDTRGTFTASGSYAIQSGEPVVATLHDATANADYTATVAADGTVDLVIGGYTYHFIAQ